MKFIKLTKGKIAMVDDADFKWLSKYSWYAKEGDRTWYACTHGPRPKQERIWMHRLLLPHAKFVDHKDLNGLQNSRSNLRAATHTLNFANMRKRSGKWTSRYKGVFWDKTRHRWRASVGGKISGIKELGRFSSEIAAAKAYDKAALAKWGEFARLNFPA